MTSSDPIYVEKKDGIATMFFNRPEKRNAINMEIWRKIPYLLKDIEADHQMKALVIRGADPVAFAAGADISEFLELRTGGPEANEYNQTTLEAQTVLEHFSKPTIAMIQGFCIGAGCELATLCDFRFSDFTGKFGITPAKLGLIYNLAGTKKLVELIGSSNAKDLLFTGRIMGADEAYRIGLINRLFDSAELEAKTYEFASQLVQNSQLSIRGSKKVIEAIQKGLTAEDETMKAFILSSFQSEDYLEGVRAFLEKRKPNFQ